jgi:hypothetical protein
MASFTEHCAETTEVLGKPFEEVHRWLDEFVGKLLLHRLDNQRMYFLNRRQQRTQRMNSFPLR